MKRNVGAPHSHPRRRHGFTLAELLVSTAVLSMLLALLCAFFEQATRAWQDGEQQADAFREARAALHLLKRDLEGLQAGESLPFFYFDDPSVFPQNPVEYSGPALQTPSAHGDALFFLSSQPCENQALEAEGDLCAVGYYPIYGREGSDARGTTRSYRLLRYFKGSGDTWSSAASEFPRGLQPFLTSLGAGKVDYTLLFPSARGTPDGDETIARNVINFRVLPLDSNNKSLVGQANLITQKPAFFEISLTALNRETSSKISSRDGWHKSAPDYGNDPLFKKNAREFRLRVAAAR